LETLTRLYKRRRALAGTPSRGEQSMLAIDPRLLMDEPTIGLAPLLTATIAGLVRQPHDLGLTIVLVEQRIGVALAVADRGAVMHQGTIDRVADRSAHGDGASLSDLVLGQSP